MYRVAPYSVLRALYRLQSIRTSSPSARLARNKIERDQVRRAARFAARVLVDKSTRPIDPTSTEAPSIPFRDSVFRNYVGG